MPISRQRAEPPDIGNRIYHVEQKVEQLQRRTLPEQNAPAAAPASIDLFNAIIDPGFPSDPGSHRYINLTDLLASESWSTDLVFIVGVVNRPGTPIVEVAGSPTIPGHLALVAFGAQGSAWALSPGSRARWNLNGARFVGSSSIIWAQGVEMFNDNASAQNDIFRSTQVVHLRDCIVHGFDDSNVRKITVVTDGPITAMDTLFMGIVFTGVVTATDCHYTWANDSSTATIFAADVHWDGGTLSGVFGSPTVLRFVSSSGTDFDIRMAALVTTQLTGSGGGTATIELGAGSGTLDIACQNAGKPFDLLVDAGMGNCEIRGDFRDITDGGVAAGDRRRYDVTCQRTMDITGPAQIRVQFTSTAGRLILQGSNIQCEAHGQLDTAGIFLTLTGCDFGWIVATCSGNGGSSQFYAIDAGSDNSVVVAMGDPASFGSASTNGSGSTIVRDASSL